MRRIGVFEIVAVVMILLMVGSMFIWIVPYLLVIGLFGVLGYLAYLLYRVLKAGFKKATAGEPQKFDESGRRITKATILEMENTPEEKKDETVH